MLREFRDIYNFTYVVWSLPSTGNADPHFASFENEKFQILELPMGHKIFALLGILLPRPLLRAVIIDIGTHPGRGEGGTCILKVTPGKINMEPGNRPLEDYVFLEPTLLFASLSCFLIHDIPSGTWAGCSLSRCSVMC